MAKLTFVLEQGQEVVVPLVEAVTLTLGRGDDNDVVVDDLRVSTHHAALERDADGRVEVRDLNSSAGTFVNGERVQSRCIVHGDTLAFGPLTAVFDVEEQQGHTNGHANERMQSTLIRPSPSRRKIRDSQPTALPADELMARRHAEQQEAIAQFEAEKTRLQNEAAAAQTQLQTWQARAARELRDHTMRMDTLQADERRLAHVSAAVKEAQALHQQWVEAVKTLSAEFEEKTLEVQRLTSTESVTRHEIAALTTHRDQALAHLHQVREECEHADIHLATLRQELSELEERSKHTKELADAREDQVKLAEKKLEQIASQRTRLEAHVKELTGSEEKLVQAEARLREIEAAHATLTAERQRLEDAVKELQQATATLEETRAAKQHAEEALHTLQAELKTRQADLATATQQLEETTARRAALADTEQKLAAATQRHTELATLLTADEARHTALQESVTSLQSKEIAIQGRLEVLHGREQDLRSELTKLGTSEHSSRDRFEEFQQLISEAEKEHSAQQEAHAQKVKAAHHEMEELESRLEPLRDWTEAMDLLYARLAELPQDSAEARDLWREIEKEKADLKALIANARSFMPKKAAASPKKAASKVPEPISHPAPPAAESPPAAEPKVSGIGLALEQTLKSRLNYLRENVQREESRLEFLRHERVRHEVRSRAGGPAGEAMKREHDRHLEAKIRHDEEHLRALHQTLDLTKTEEEKRRAKIAEMERKLTELHAGITEAERHRSDLRHQADLAHTELKNFESTLERLKKMADSEAAKA